MEKERYLAEKFQQITAEIGTRKDTMKKIFSKRLGWLSIIDFVVSLFAIFISFLFTKIIVDNAIINSFMASSSFESRCVIIAFLFVLLLYLGRVTLNKDFLNKLQTILIWGIYAILLTINFVIYDKKAEFIFIPILIYVVVILFIKLFMDKFIFLLINEENKFIKILPLFIKKRFPKIKKYFKEKPSAYFIISFIILIVLASISQIAGKKWLSGKISEWAYIALVIGVGIELWHLIKKSRKNNSKSKR